MGSFDQLVLDVLKDGSTKSFQDILSRGGFSHNTLKRYLRRLMDQGLVLRAERVENRRGRPAYGYHLTPKLRKQLDLTVTEPYVILVTLTFSKLKKYADTAKADSARQEKETAPHTSAHR